jgi:hypothetical protein
MIRCVLSWDRRSRFVAPGTATIRRTGLALHPSAGNLPWWDNFFDKTLLLMEESIKRTVLLVNEYLSQNMGCVADDHRSWSLLILICNVQDFSKTSDCG